MKDKICCKCKLWTPYPTSIRGACNGKTTYAEDKCRYDIFKPNKECCGHPMSKFCDTNESPAITKLYCPICKKIEIA